jgi:hypothetical protein
MHLETYLAAEVHVYCSALSKFARILTDTDKLFKRGVKLEMSTWTECTSRTFGHCTPYGHNVCGRAAAGAQEAVEPAAAAAAAANSHDRLHCWCIECYANSHDRMHCWCIELLFLVLSTGAHLLQLVVARYATLSLAVTTATACHLQSPLH